MLFYQERVRPMPKPDLVIARPGSADVADDDADRRFTVIPKSRNRSPAKLTGIAPKTANEPDVPD